MKSTFLKVMAILCLIFGIIGAIVSVFGVIAVGALSSFGIAMPIGSSIIAIIESILMIVAGAYGIGASSNPAKAGKAMIIGIILIILAVVSIIMGVVEANALVAQFASLASEIGGVDVGAIPSVGVDWTNFTGLIMPVLYCIAAFLFKKKAAA